MQALAKLRADLSAYIDLDPPDEIEVYTELADVPDDEIAVPDGDDSLLAEFDGRSLPEHVAGPPRNAPASAKRRRVVQLHRTLKLGMTGKDALAVKRALRAAGYGKGTNLTRRFGRAAVRNLKAFQRKHKLKVDGVYGPTTHEALARYFDSYGAWLMAHAPHPKPNSPAHMRQKIVAAMIFGYNHRGQIHYTQGPSRMYGVRHRVKPPGVPYFEDCSSFMTWCFWVAGAPDPNGLGYNGQGYTGTLARRGRRKTAPNAADLDMYGRGFPFHHVAGETNGRGPIISHGSEIGPVKTTRHYRSDYYVTYDELGGR